MGLGKYWDFYKQVAKEMRENQGQDPGKKEYYICQFRPGGELEGRLEEDRLLVLT